MSECLPSRWLLAAALLIVVQSSALADQPKMPPVPQTAPPPVPTQTGPGRYYDVPLLIEEEQISEHGAAPHVAPPVPAMPLVLPHLPPGQPTCDDDDDPNPAQVMTLRCLLFTINPLAAFLPLDWHTDVPSADLPAPVYLQHPPQYIPSDLAFPLLREEASMEQVGMPDEVERLDFMPTEIEVLDVMPAEESEPRYELLEPWNDSTNLFRLPLLPLTEIEVGVREQKTGVMLFGLNIELSRTGTIVVNGKSEAAPEQEVLPQPRSLSEIGPRTQAFNPSNGVGFMKPSIEKYELILNHTRLLPLKETPFRIQIADTNIVDYVVLDPAKDILMQGTKVGSTTMKMWFGDRNNPAEQTVVDCIVNVLPDPDVKRRLEAVYKALQDEINRAFPDDYVCLNLADDQLIVSGEVKDAVDADRILQIVGRTDPTPTALNPVLANPVSLPLPDLTRPHPNAQEKPKIVNMLHIPSEQQVKLNVTLASVNRGAAREIGLGWTLTSQKSCVLLNNSNGMTSVSVPTVLDNGTIDRQIQTLQQNNLAKTLAEPALVTLNGRPATFFTGLPCPVPQVTCTNVGISSLDYQATGLTLTFLPIITDRDRIRLTISSAVAATGSTSGNPTQMTGLNAETLQIEVDMRQGQTFAIAGLMPTGRFYANLVPVLSELPLIGHLFPCELSRISDDELVLLVRPEIVEPPQAPAAPPAPKCPCLDEAKIHDPANTQVRLNIVVAEMDSKAARTLNVNRKSGNASSWALEVADDARQKALRDGLSSMRENGHAELVSQPCMMTLSGQQGSFLCGGAQAIPHIDANGQDSVQFEDFGTRFTCRPIVHSDGNIRLEVESEYSEISPIANDDPHGLILAGRTSQRVNAVAELPRGHALVICGPKTGSKSRLMLMVTPQIVETPAAPQLLDFIGDALRKYTKGFGVYLNAYPADPQRRMMVLMNQSENLRQIENEMARFWTVDLPSHRTPVSVPAFKCEAFPEESVHELLLKCQRELSRGHVAGAQDMAQQALSRNREETLTDPLVVAGLLQRVKEVATIPLGTVDPGAAKPASAVTGTQGEGKAIGSKERMVQALIDAFNVAYKEGRYRDAESLAVSATEIDPENGTAVAARTIVRNQMEMIRRNQEALAPMPPPVPQYAIIRPALPPIDPAVVNALQKILIESEKSAPAGGVEESEPKNNDHPPQR